MTSDAPPEDLIDLKRRFLIVEAGAARYGHKAAIARLQALTPLIQGHAWWSQVEADRGRDKLFQARLDLIAAAKEAMPELLPDTMPDLPPG